MNNENISLIALGSNVGDKVSNLQTAVRLINTSDEIKVLEASSIYETKPYGVKDQSNFLNAVIKVSTSLSLVELLNFVKNLEKEIGRKERIKWGPREIDLDILFYNDLIYSDERITIPHKEFEKRDFVIVPSVEIAKNYFHPALNVKICDISIQNLEKNIIRILPDNLL